MDVLLANPRGFCAGVDRAIAIVEQALAQLRRADLRAPRGRAQQVRRRRPQGQGRGVRRGARRGAGGQHGRVLRARRVEGACARRPRRAGSRVFDATCPLVTKVHVEVAKMREQGREIVMIGHAGHPEVEGTMGQCDGGIYLVESVADVERLAVADPDALAYVTQTTLSVDDAAAIVEALKRRFPRIVGPKKDDICYATQNRQDAVKVMAPQVDVVIVVGSPNSSNSNRLREVAANRGVRAVHDRPRRRAPARVGRRQAPRRRHRGRVGAGGARAGGDRAARGARRQRRARARRRARAHRVSAAERSCRTSRRRSRRKWDPHRVRRPGAGASG